MRKTIKRIVTLAFLGLMAVGAYIAYSTAQSKSLLDRENLEALTDEESEVQFENCSNKQNSRCIAYVVTGGVKSRTDYYEFDEMELKLD